MRPNAADRATHTLQRPTVIGEVASHAAHPVAGQCRPCRRRVNALHTASGTVAATNANAKPGWSALLRSTVTACRARDRTEVLVTTSAGPRERAMRFSDPQRNAVRFVATTVRDAHGTVQLMVNTWSRAVARGTMVR